MMSEQEAIDCEELKRSIASAKQNFYTMCETIERATPEQLKHMGLREKTKAEGMMHYFYSYQKDIKKIMDAHIRKYPD